MTHMTTNWWRYFLMRSGNPSCICVFVLSRSHGCVLSTWFAWCMSMTWAIHIVYSYTRTRHKYIEIGKTDENYLIRSIKINVFVVVLVIVGSCCATAAAAVLQMKWASERVCVCVCVPVHCSMRLSLWNVKLSQWYCDIIFLFSFAVFYYMLFNVQCSLSFDWQTSAILAVGTDAGKMWTSHTRLHTETVDNRIVVV